MAAEWTVIIPIKPLDTAKTRLGRRDAAPPLAFAFAQDAVSAALACPAVGAVAVATRDPDVTAWAIARGAKAVDDTGHPGINPAVELAAEAMGSLTVAALLSDLPCLTPQSLAAVLDLAASHQCAFLPDHSGSGTTIWTRTAPGPSPSFGAHSATRHRLAGAVDLTTALPAKWAGARLDVDTLDDLELALRIGVGEHTRRALNR